MGLTRRELPAIRNKARRQEERRQRMPTKNGIQRVLAANLVESIELAFNDYNHSFMMRKNLPAAMTAETAETVAKAYRENGWKAQIETRHGVKQIVIR